MLITQLKYINDRIKEGNLNPGDLWNIVKFLSKLYMWCVSFLTLVSLAVYLRVEVSPLLALCVVMLCFAVYTKRQSVNLPLSRTFTRDLVQQRIR